MTKHNPLSAMSNDAQTVAERPLPEHYVAAALVGMGLFVAALIIGLVVGSQLSGTDDEGGLQGLLIGAILGLGIGGLAVGLGLTWRGLRGRPLLVYLVAPPGIWVAVAAVVCGAAGAGRELPLLGLLGLVPSIAGAALGTGLARWTRQVRSAGVDASIPGAGGCS